VTTRKTLRSELFDVKIAVYCGSSAGNDPAFGEAAYALGVWMGRNGHALIYGGSRTGMMGAVADGVLSAGGAVTGVVPDVPLIRSRIHSGLTTLIETGTVADRKARMLEEADAFIALPGGLGTLDEITEILSLESLGLARGPVILYNTKGYYEPLRTVFSAILHNGFGRQEFFSGVYFIDSPEALGRLLPASP
jgi:hypothetical protein